MRRRSFLTSSIATAAGFGAAACRKKADSHFRGHVFVATEESSAIAVVDLGGFTMVRRVELDSPATELVLGKALFATLPAANAVQEIDAQAWNRTRRVRLDGRPLGMRISRSTGMLWVLQSNRPALAGIGLDDFRIRAHIGLPGEPVAFDRLGSMAAVTLTDGSLVLADLTTRRLSLLRGLSAELGAVHFRTDGEKVLVADRAARQLIVVDMKARKVAVRLVLAIRPDHLCFKSDGGQLFVTGEGRDAVVIAYPYRAEVAQTHLSGRAPGAMAVCSQPDYLFVSNPGAGSVTIFDIDTQRVLAVAGVGSNPGPIVVTPDQEYALVLNTGSGDMAVIRTAAITPGRAKQAPLFTMIPVGARPVSAVVRAA